MDQYFQNLQIRRYTGLDASAWDHYLANHPQGNFYQRSGWKTINECCFGHEVIYLIAEERDRIVGLFPMVSVKSRLFGHILSSMPFVNFGGLCADSPVVAERLLDEARRVTRECDADYLEIRTMHPLSDQLPTSHHKISMTLDLDNDPDVLWNGFKSKHRTNIRRVYKEGVEVKKGRHELLDTFYMIMAKSWKSLGTPIYRKSYFERILDTFPEDTLIFVAYHKDQPVATAFNGYHNGMVEGMWAGALPECRRIQPNYVLYWEMIKDACERNMQHYHLGRSSADSGAESFKKKWNAYATQLHWQYILHNQADIPQLNVNNPKFELAIKLWRKLPLSLTTTLGPFLSRSIP